MKHLTLAALVNLFVFFVVLGAMIFFSAGTIHYWQGWLYLATFSIACLVITVYFLKYDPELVKRRMEAGPGAEKEKSQKIIMTISLILFLALTVIPPLDVRYGWSYVPAIVVYLSDLLILFGFYIVFLVFKQNTYTAATIAVHKKQKVISTGWYGIVRHPMYFGGLFIILFAPISLGSWWGVIIGVLLCFMIVLRLLDEEKYLKKNLDGYTEYCKKVKYHLIPFVW